jgi:hypothetical protein
MALQGFYSNEEFIDAWFENGQSPKKVALALGVAERNVYQRRNRLVAAGHELPTIKFTPDTSSFAYPQRVHVNIENGFAVIASDRHKWPGDGISPAEAALHVLLERREPDLFILNGDLFDGATTSRHAPLGWERKPDATQELAACREFMDSLEYRLPSAKKFWTIGNHDRRFDYTLAHAAYQFRDLPGLRLFEHFPGWDYGWSLHINSGVPGGHTVVKHKHRQGVMAARNNALTAGVNIVTGHTHALTVTPVEDYLGRRYGVECGFLSYKQHPAFEYAEDGPSYARPGFAVLTWRDGVLQPPELVEVDDANVAWFRGEPITLPKPKVRVKAKMEK